VIADATVGTAGDPIAIGGGGHGVNLHIATADLLKATDATVADVTEPEPDD
jgi:prolyl-tRNA editing enzyme YbaK/EbsC (Cys-tRNA(Pro) deacylase)